MTTLEQVVAACARLQRSRARERAALIDRDRVIADWWVTSGVPKSQASATIRQALEAAGWSRDEIASVGVSGGSVIATLHPLR